MSSIWKYLYNNRKWVGILCLFAAFDALLNVGVIVSENLAHHQDPDWTFYLINEFTGAFTILLFIPFLIFFFRKWPLRRPQLFGKIALYVFASMIFGFLYTTVMYTARVPIYAMAGITRLNEIFNELPYRYLMEYFKQFFAFWLVYIVWWGITQYQANRNRELQEAELKEELLKAQVQSLQMQLHPHFFFNTLNTISSIMYKDPARADKLISRLSDFLRNVIGLKNQPLHSLEKEIELLKQFTDVMLERYPDKLKVHYQVSPDCLGAEVPVLILQPIVENAIKYAIDFRPLTEIEVNAACSSDGLSLGIRDNGPGIREGAITHGTGLSSTVQRLQKLYRDQFEFELRNREGGGVEVVMALADRRPEVIEVKES